MMTRGLVAGFVFGLGLVTPVLANDEALRDYDRASLNFLFEQAQFGGPVSGMSEDDMLITGSIGTSVGGNEKKEQRDTRGVQRLPVSRPSH